MPNAAAACPAGRGATVPLLFTPSVSSTSTLLLPRARRSPVAGPGGGDDPGTEAGAGEGEGETGDPEPLRGPRRRPDVAHPGAGQAAEPLGAQPPPQRQEAEREQQQRPGEAHRARSRASRRAMAESAATSVPWAEAKATRSTCP